MSALTRRSLALAGCVAVLTWPVLADGQPLSGDALIAALKSGGYVVIMRHAHAPANPPAQADLENSGRERQLDDVGRRAAADLDAALKALNIPVGVVWSSPTYRAQQTARLAGLPEPRVNNALGDGGVSMQAVGSPEAAFLKIQTLTNPKQGSDTFVVTQLPNIVAAIGPVAADMADGEALIFKPDGKLTPNLVGRLKIEDWTAAARR